MVEVLSREEALLERYHRDVMWFGAHRNELRKRYPDQWVGVYREQVIGASPDLRKLLRETKANGRPPGEGFYDFVHANPADWVYTRV